jgi:hypothetical protein
LSPERWKNVLLEADYTCRRERRKGEFAKNSKIFVGKVPKWETRAINCHVPSHPSLPETWR